jgi:hypothetical protein
LAALAVLASPDDTRSRGRDLDAEVRANYLYKFTPFVTWPASAFAGVGSPFNLCVLGVDPLGSALDEAVRDRQVAGHPIVVRRLPRGDGVSGCHLVYAASARGPAGDVLKSVARLPVLTVTEDGSSSANPIVQFTPYRGRLRFKVDVAAAQGAGLVMSSQLLALALAEPEGRP